MSINTVEIDALNDKNLIIDMRNAKNVAIKLFEISHSVVMLMYGAGIVLTQGRKWGCQILSSYKCQSKGESLGVLYGENCKLVFHQKLSF